jgi:hypothetical protein
LLHLIFFDSRLFSYEENEEIHSRKFTLINDPHAWKCMQWEEVLWTTKCQIVLLSIFLRGAACSKTKRKSAEKEEKVFWAINNNRMRLFEWNRLRSYVKKKNIAFAVFCYKNGRGKIVANT